MQFSFSIKLCFLHDFKKYIFRIMFNGSPGFSFLVVLVYSPRGSFVSTFVPIGYGSVE